MANDFSGKRVAIYSRVSTKRQAQNDLSVPDQIAHAERWIAEQGAILAKSFVDGGASATNDNRPEFQKMIAEAKADDGEIDVILVHSLSLVSFATLFTSCNTRLNSRGTASGLCRLHSRLAMIPPRN